MISSLTEAGRVGMTAIGATPEAAQDFYEQAEMVLLKEARTALEPPAVRL